MKDSFEYYINYKYYLSHEDTTAAGHCINHLFEHGENLALHSLSVGMIAVDFADSLYLKDNENLFLGALLHDIGKTRISPEILNKKGKLNKDEWKEMELHPIWGVHALFVRRFFNQEALEIIKMHHVHYDRGGYPKSKSKPTKKEQIVSIADAFDAMCSDRPYSEGKSLEAALEELIENSGTQFSPALVEDFIELAPKYYKITQKKNKILKEGI